MRTRRSETWLFIHLPLLYSLPAPLQGVTFKKLKHNTCSNLLLGIIKPFCVPPAGRYATDRIKNTEHVTCLSPSGNWHIVLKIHGARRFELDMNDPEYRTPFWYTWTSGDRENTIGTVQLCISELIEDSILRSQNRKKGTNNRKTTF
jgi:hypothetical protein